MLCKKIKVILLIKMNSWCHLFSFYQALMLQKFNNQSPTTKVIQLASEILKSHLTKHFIQNNLLIWKSGIQKTPSSIKLKITNKKMNKFYKRKIMSKKLLPRIKKT